jgi:hypothetical protein
MRERWLYYRDNLAIECTTEVFRHGGDHYKTLEEIACPMLPLQVASLHTC